MRELRDKLGDFLLLNIILKVLAIKAEKKKIGPWLEEKW